ncbi:MAG: hypothetical protein JXP34_12285 [Planctomycetes bacterium]|nr:hypothetical protein [Planctomycetota bacterium]
MIRRYGRMLPCLLPVFLLVTTSLSAFTDEFDDDPTDAGSGWELYAPRAGVVHSTDEGWWIVTMPAGINLDHWSTVDYATQLRRYEDVLDDDFVVETHVRFLGSGDPDSPTWPPTDEAYQAGIMIYFSTLNMYYWGFYTDTTLQLERSGAGGLCSVNPGLQELSLQVKRVGSVYSFSYRASDDLPWKLVCTQTYDVATYPVLYAGLVFKSWAPTITQQETFAFDYFSILDSKTPLIQEVAPDPLPAFERTPFRFTPTLVDAFPDPTWSITEPAGATIDSATGEILWAPAAGDAGKTVKFAVEADNGVGSDSEEFDVVVKPAEFLDPFDGTEYEKGWEFHMPWSGASADLSGAGFVEMRIPNYAEGGNHNYDTWSTVDFMPKLRLRYTPDEDFAIETFIELIEPPGTPNYYTTGLWVQFDDPTVERNLGCDGLMFGYYSSAAFTLTNTINVERTGGLSARGPDVSCGEPAIYIRIERKSDDYLFLWKVQEEDDWILHHTMTITGMQVTHVGLFVKNWSAVSPEVIADFDYFLLEPKPEECPTITPACDFGDPDTAWVGLPYVRSLAMAGNPYPDLTVASGPAMSYDRTTQLLTGWTPDKAETVALKLEAVNGVEPCDEAVLDQDVEVLAPYTVPDDPFDEDPRDDDTGYWEFYEPLGGGQFFILEDPDETTWWRMAIPTLGTGNVAFDHWTTVDNGVQLRHAIDPAVDQLEFVVETRMRLDPGTALPEGNAFHVGLMLYFSQYNILYFGPGQLRAATGWNILLERSGVQNILGTYAPNLRAGVPVRLRIERKCETTYNFFWLDESAETPEWEYIASYTHANPPLYAGLVMKTWGGLANLTYFDFDYFDLHYRGEPPVGPQGPFFIRGDADGSGNFTIGDGVQVLERQFTNRPAFTSNCDKAGDFDDTGFFTIGDAIGIFNLLFASGANPPAPYPGCGMDPTPDALTCEESTAFCKP